MKTLPIISFWIFTFSLGLTSCEKESFSPTEDEAGTSQAFDLNGDGYPEALITLAELPVWESHLADQNNDGRPDALVLGTAGGARLGPPWDVDNDRSPAGVQEWEWVVFTAALPSDLPPVIDLDGDGDPDLVLFADAQEDPSRIDIDGDGEEELIQTDDKLAAGKSKAESLDDDSDPDKITLGGKGGATRQPNEDVDGDQEQEIVIEDPTVDPDDTKGIDLDGDGDPDIIIIGTKKAKRSANTDTDGDGNTELVIEDSTLDSPKTKPIDLDGDGTPDGVVIGTGDGGTRDKDADIDGDGEPEIIIRGGKREGKVDPDGDGDPDVIYLK